MAPRWQIITPHYLHVDGTEWEYTETDRSNGRLIRKKFSVPRYINPLDPADWTERQGKDEGQTYLTNDPRTDHANDIVFHGEPTPDMIPVNDEAKAISAELAKTKWKHPIESLPGTFSQSLLDDMQRQMAEIQSQTTKPSTQVEGMQELLGAIAGMMKQNQEILQAAAGNRRI